MSMYPPERSAQTPYSSVADNPKRTACDMWGDLVKGGIMLFSKNCDRLVGPRMESRLSFVTQKDAAEELGVEVRYISDSSGKLTNASIPVRIPW